MKTKHLLSLSALFFAASISFCAENSGLILPMPGQIFEQPKTQPVKQKTQAQALYAQPAETRAKTQQSQTTHTTQQAPARQRRNPNVIKPLDPNRVFIPLPPSGQRSKPQPPNIQNEQKPAIIKTKNDPQSLIQLPDQTESTESYENSEQDIPSANYSTNPDEIPAPSEESLANANNQQSDVEPPIITTETPQVVTTENSGSITVFPKDTSSAIFMVMKSWQCEDYDASTLLSHAVGVYAQEADDEFAIEGLPTENDSYTVSIEEEDITLDELLDIIAQKAGRDWGVDMANKTIYFYPAGVTEAANDNW